MKGFSWHLNVGSSKMGRDMVPRIDSWSAWVNETDRTGQRSGELLAVLSVLTLTLMII